MDSNSKLNSFDEIEEPSSKIMKSEAEDKILKIIDLNDPCLKHIFNYLDLNDLLNVGESNTTLQYAAGLVFKEKCTSVSIGWPSWNLKCACKFHWKWNQFDLLEIQYYTYYNHSKTVDNNRNFNESITRSFQQQFSTKNCIKNRYFPD